MSLYIGKDINGDSVLHTTSDVQSEVDMKSGILSSTVFHSLLPYISITVYDCTNITPKTGLGSGYFMTTTQATVCFVPSEARAKINNGYRYFVIGDDSVSPIWPFSQAYYNNSFCWQPTSSDNPLSYLSNLLPGTNEYIAIGNYLYSTVKVVVFENITLTSGYILPQLTTDSIILDNTQINVKGQDLASFCYLSSTILNSVDDVFSIFGSGNTMQCINSRITGSDMSFDSTTIKKNNQTIFNTAQPSKLKYKQTVSYSVPYGQFTGGPYENVNGELHTITASSPLQEGDLFTIDLQDDTTGNTKPWITLMEYRENNYLQEPPLFFLHSEGSFRMHGYIKGTSSGGLSIEYFGSFGGGRLYSHAFTYVINIYKD